MIFGEHMVLQRAKEIKIWGKSVRNDTVTVKLHDQEAQVICADGNWQVTLKPEEACEKTTLKVCSEKTSEVIEFNDVAIGEVWLAGGQSNMEFLMKYDVDLKDTLKLPDDDLLRFFRYPQVNFTGLLEIADFPDDGFWRKWDKEENRIFFSAVGAYMAMGLRKKLGVPVGIIGCNWGGSPASAWCEMEDIKNNKAMAPILKWHEDACNNTDWAKYIPASEVKPLPPTPEQKEFENRFMMGEDMTEFFKNFDPSKLPKLDYAPFDLGPRSVVRPAGLYETMLKKIAPYAIKGAIWYQGEDDDARGWYDFYDESMKTLITGWRKLWGYEFPFYQIELAPFQGIGATGAKKYDLMRHQQHKAMEALNDVYDVCILDAGEQFNIHPRRKKMVGERLERIVMKHTYGDESLTADCPEAVSAERKDDKIIITFRNSAEGLCIKGDLREELNVLVDNEHSDYEYEVSNDQLVITGKFDKPAVVEYCEKNYCVARIYNSEGNPAYGFRYEV